MKRKVLNTVAFLCNLTGSELFDAVAAAQIEAGVLAAGLQQPAELQNEPLASPATFAQLLSGAEAATATLPPPPEASAEGEGQPPLPDDSYPGTVAAAPAPEQSINAAPALDTSAAMPRPETLHPAPEPTPPKHAPINFPTSSTAKSADDSPRPIPWLEPAQPQASSAAKSVLQLVSRSSDGGVGSGSRSDQNRQGGAAARTSPLGSAVKVHGDATHVHDSFMDQLRDAALLELQQGYKAPPNLNAAKQAAFASGDGSNGIGKNMAKKYIEEQQQERKRAGATGDDVLDKLSAAVRQGLQPSAAAAAAAARNTEVQQSGAQNSRALYDALGQGVQYAIAQHGTQADGRAARDVQPAHQRDEGGGNIHDQLGQAFSDHLGRGRSRAAGTAGSAAHAHKFRRGDSPPAAHSRAARAADTAADSDHDKLLDSLLDGANNAIGSGKRSREKSPAPAERSALPSREAKRHATDRQPQPRQDARQLPKHAQGMRYDLNRGLGKCWLYSCCACVGIAAMLVDLFWADTQLAVCRGVDLQLWGHDYTTDEMRIMRAFCSLKLPVQQKYFMDFASTTRAKLGVHRDIGTRAVQDLASGRAQCTDARVRRAANFITDDCATSKLKFLSHEQCVLLMACVAVTCAACTSCA